MLHVWYSFAQDGGTVSVLPYMISSHSTRGEREGYRVVRLYKFLLLAGKGEDQTCLKGE